ncbi:MAG TPA: penicillin-binding protein 2 [Flavobacteriia bacterium]|nr:penicillin-binding protein 2 [Flavobacteriia bacterium]
MNKRSYLLFGFVITIGLLFTIRLFYLQIINNSFKQQAIDNSIKKKYLYPERGYIYDRNGKLLVANQTSYDLMVIPRDVKTLDTTEFCKLLHIDKKSFEKRLRKAKRYSKKAPSVFIKQLSKADFAYLQEKLYKFNGFYIQKKPIRNYPINSAANVVGYISEVNERLLKKNKYYHQGELIGIAGVEKSYEKFLRGKKGIKRYQTDTYGRTISSYKNGKSDILPQNGKDLTLTIDSDLQQFGEKLLQNKRGAIVALDPKTGEILSLVTAPSYNPNDMVGRKRSKYSYKYMNDKFDQPMFDRSLQAQYAPGSTFKMLNGLIGLEEQVITPFSTYPCYHGYRYGRRKNEFMGCHCGTNGLVSFNRAIYRSCNSFFANAYKKSIEKYVSPKVGMDNWSKHVKSFGLGNYLGVDLPVGKKGLIPNSKFYDKFYPSFSWRAASTISNAIGQGQVETTPIQLANMTAAIANKGYFITPHIVKAIQDTIIDKKFTTKKYTSIDTVYFDPVIKGMQDVFEKGTGKYAKIKGMHMAGKTGTVQNFIKRDGEKIALQDHSIFIAFAPVENPKIAVAVFIENGGFGSTYAAPIASLVIEKYLNGKITRKALNKKIQDASLYNEYNKQLDSLNFE